MGEKGVRGELLERSKRTDLRPVAYSAQGFESLTHHHVVFVFHKNSSPVLMRLGRYPEPSPRALLHLANLHVTARGITPPAGQQLLLLRVQA